MLEKLKSSVTIEMVATAAAAAALPTAKQIKTATNTLGRLICLNVLHVHSAHMRTKIRKCI